MSPIKSLLGGIALSVTLAGTAMAGAFDVNVTTTGLAMRGYDPVAYFTEGEPTRGNFQITSVYEDATYRFASKENKALFEANPEAYVPAYGGYCAFGTAMGIKVDGDPSLWKIVDNTLYLNLSPAVQERWLGDTAGFISQADVKWVDIEDADPVALLNQ